MIEQRPRNNAARSPNLFLKTRLMAVGNKENHLTEFFAATLATIPSFAEDYLAFVLAAFPPARTWGRLTVSAVDTQADFPDVEGVPDMVLTIQDQHRKQHLLGCEHKIEAGETVTRKRGGLGVELGSSDETEELLQLDRYLGSGRFEAVLYVRESYKDLRDSVWGNDRYVRPSGGATHFLWRDFYPALARAATTSALAGWLFEGFGQLGYTPPTAVLGDLYSKDKVLRASNRENLGKLWQTTRHQARALGWSKSNLGSKVELYLSGNADSAATQVFINPVKGAHVVVTITPAPGRIDRIVQRLETALPSYAKQFASMSAAPEVVRGEAARKEGREAVVRVTSSLPAILGPASTVHEIELGLAAYVGGILAIIDQRELDQVTLARVPSTP